MCRVGLKPRKGLNKYFKPKTGTDIIACRLRHNFFNLQLSAMITVLSRTGNPLECWLMLHICDKRELHLRPYLICTNAYCKCLHSAFKTSSFSLGLSFPGNQMVSMKCEGGVGKNVINFPYSRSNDVLLEILSKYDVTLSFF